MTRKNGFIKTLTDREYWNEIERTSCDSGETVIFEELFSKYLENVDNGKIAIEIGCVPGLHLAYVCKYFGYFPEGIDFVKGSEEITGKTLRNFGLYKYKIYSEDFLRWKPAKKYDIVLSFGFVEHFSDPDEIIKRHIDLLEKDGKIILEVPNFAYGQKILHNSVDRNNLLRHNLKVMNKSYFKIIAKKFDLKIRYLGYYGGLFDFWSENKNPTKTQRIVSYILTKIAQFAKRISLNNKYFSPYLVMVATRN